MKLCFFVIKSRQIFSSKTLPTHTHKRPIFKLKEQSYVSKWKKSYNNFHFKESVKM